MDEQRAVMEQILAENKKSMLQIITYLRHPHTVSADLDAQTLDVIMPSQPDELPVESGPDFQELNSKLKDNQALKAKLVSIKIQFLNFCYFYIFCPVF
jgi:hypothetical protein